MKLLLLTPQAPFPPRQGATIRNFALIRHLAQRHTVDLLCFLAPGEQLTEGSPLHRYCRRVAAVPQPVRSASQRALDTLRSPLPDMALRLEAAEMHTLVQRWVAEGGYDLIQFEGIEMAQYGLPEPGVSDWPATLFDEHNCEYLLQQRNAFTDLRQPLRWPAAVYSLIQWQKLRRYEALICRQADAVVAVSEADRAALAAIAPGVAITVASNGVEVADYAANPAAGSRLEPPYTLLFAGKMDYRPNIDAVLWFAERVLPLIQAQAPAVRLQIVGLNPHRRLDPLRANPAIEITGAVPDIRPFLQRAAVCLIPMRVGGGTRLKALEAMAAGKAVVSTRVGVEGIPVRPGRELLLADTPADFAAAVLAVLTDSTADGSLARRLGEAARQFVQTHYDWAQIIPIFAGVYEQALAQHAALGHTGKKRDA